MASATQSGGGPRTGLTVFLAVFFGFLGGAAGSYLIGQVTGGGSGEAVTASAPEPAAPNQSPRRLNLTGAEATTSQMIVKAVENVNPAVVNIDTLGSRPGRSNTPFDDFFFGPGPQGPGDRQQGPQLRGSGSGFIFNAAEGLVMTNQHVIEGAEKIIVTVGQTREFEAEPVGADKMSDIAVLRLKPDNLPEAPLGLRADTKQGEWVIAIGNPFREFPHTVTVGVVSALNRRMPVGDRVYNNLIQTDAAINMGNSGGPLCNITGEVIGVNSAIFSPTQTYAGIGFAIVIDDAMVIANNLINHGGVPWLGVAMRDLDDAIRTERGLPAELTGVVIDQVVDGSPAATGGVQNGDVVVSMGGTAVASSDEVQAAVLAAEIAKPLEVKVWRGGKEVTCSITIGTRPN